ncbi:hypothetical protein DRN72_00465 [Methanosarcinales archaeon]|nr:MAG: hypothetical protein DRN72_00465 [Methanosarcinales archaeon]
MHILRLANPENVVGIGVHLPDDMTEVMKTAILNSLLRAKKWARIVVVCPYNSENMFKRFETITSDNPAKELVKMIDNEIEGGVRGNLSANKTLSALRRRGINVRRGVILERAINHSILGLVPVGIDEGQGVDEKVELGLRIAKLLS